MSDATLPSPGLAAAPSAGLGLPPYAAAWGMVAHPFPVTPDETRYYFTPEIEDLYSELRHFVEMRKGFMLLTGDVGLGKTTLLRRLLASFDRSQVNTALVLTGFLDQAELLEAIARDFGLQLKPGARRFDHLDALYRFLLAESDAGKNNLLVIDDAQALDAQALDVVRQLSNFETAQSKLIQIVLCGQTELRESLDQHGLRQVKSRIALARELHPLDAIQVRQYIQHRLTAAGGAPLPMDAAALARLHALTGGFPRRIHHLMDRCLYALMASDARALDAATVDRAWADLGWEPVPAPAQAALPVPAKPPRRPAALLLPGLAGLVLGLVLLGVWVQRDTKPAAATPVLALAQPANWETVRGSYAGLAALTWPAASTGEGVQQLLERQLASGPARSRWQTVLARGDGAQACAGKPAVTLQDPGGERWQLVFVESGLPTAAVVLGEQRPILRGMQQYLHGRGWLVAGSIDGVMGPLTMAALGRFQAEEGLTGTGQFDPATAHRLSCRLPPQVLAAPAAGTMAAGA